MELKKLRRSLPSFVGGPVDTERFSDNASHSTNREKRTEVIRSRLEDLPTSGEIEAELSFPGVEGLEDDSQVYTGKEEVVSAYETWMAEYDMDEELLSYDIVKYPSSGEFEIRLEEIEEVFTTEWTGPHHANRKHYRDNFDEIGKYEEVHRVETGDTVAILEGEYERSV